MKFESKLTLEKRNFHAKPFTLIMVNANPHIFKYCQETSIDRFFTFSYIFTDIQVSFDIKLLL